MADETKGVGLISGFEGKWCDSNEAYCFKLDLADDSDGTLEYYQERKPFKESFSITYADEYNIVSTLMVPNRFLS